MTDEFIGIEVGKVLPGWKSGLPERVQFDFTNSGAVFILAYNSPTDKELEQIGKGKIRIGIVHTRCLTFMLLKLGNLPWSDAPYSVQFSKPFEITEIAEGDKSHGYATNIIALDNRTGIVKVIRFFTMPYEVSKRLERAIGIQRELIKAKKMPNDEAYDFLLSEVYRTYSTERLVAAGYKEEVEGKK